MDNDPFCDGCAYLEYELPANHYDVHRAQCSDPEKPMAGLHRVIAVSPVVKPFQITRPAWCRGKRIQTGGQHHNEI